MATNARGFYGHFSRFSATLTLSRSKPALNVVLGLGFRRNLPFQLGVLYRAQDFAEKRPGLVAHLKQIVPGKQPRGPDLLCWRLCECAADKCVRFKTPVAGEAIQPVQLQVLLESRDPDKALQRRSPHLFDVLE